MASRLDPRLRGDDNGLVSLSPKNLASATQAIFSWQFFGAVC